MRLPLGLTWLRSSILPLVVTSLWACGAEPNRAPFAPATGARGGEAGAIIPGGSGGPKGGSGGSSAGSGGKPGEADGGAAAMDTTLRVGQFSPDFKLDPLNLSASGTVFYQTPSAWEEVPYEGEPLEIPSGALAFRFVPASERYLTTLTARVPVADVPAIGVALAQDLSAAFGQLEVFDEPDPEAGQLVAYLHDELGQPWREAVPELPGAEHVAFLSLGTWSDLADQTSEEGVFFAANIDPGEFGGGSYAFVVRLLGKNYPITVPVEAGAVTYVEVEIPQP